MGGASCSPNSISVKEKTASNKEMQKLKSRGTNKRASHKTQLKENLESLKQKQYVLKAVMYMRMTLKSIN